MINIDYLYDPTFAKSFFGKNYFVERKLGFQVIEKGTILPHKWTAPPGKWSWGAGGIVDGNGEYVTSSFFYRSGDHNYTPPCNQFNTALRPSFISTCFFMFGDTS